MECQILKMILRDCKDIFNQQTFNKKAHFLKFAPFKVSLKVPNSNHHRVLGTVLHWQAIGHVWFL